MRKLQLQETTKKQNHLIKKSASKPIQNVIQHIQSGGIRVLRACMSSKVKCASLRLLQIRRKAAMQPLSSAKENRRADNDAEVLRKSTSEIP